MKVAVAYENGKVFQHFGHTKQFKVYDIKDGKVQATSTVDTNGSGHGALADILKKHSIDTLICGGIGEGAKSALAEAEIELYGGVSGDVEQTVKDLLSGNLKYNPDVSCNHNGEHHHGEHHHGEHHDTHHCRD